MRILWLSLFLLLLNFGHLAHAQPQQTLFNGSLKFNAEGIPVVIPLRIDQKPIRPGSQSIRLDATAHVNRLLPAISQQLVRSVKQLHSPCEHSWTASKPLAGVVKQKLILKVSASYQNWFCSDWVTHMLFTESGTIESHIQPHIDKGKLQFRIAYFAIDGLSDVASFIGVQGFIQDEIQTFLDQINNNPDIALLPQTYRDLGFRYQDIKIDNVEGLPTVKIGISGPNRPRSLDQLKRFLNSFNH